ncbi:uncharacterized protein LOC132895434 isoform X2 [Neoarius graeffei]|uniref:uncharacterized protein LOC132895434 isoform X2 n=1 Tax=Neoarius graeffei TaxID=443677 RepID=UPI00298D2E50|nr:uncharacterized protein LOC132895434 isoform X2 [Neoarius graeffei]
MAAWTEVNTVWIGFMDIVPVIGTVKEAVELVLAVYEGNKAVIKEKEKAAENFVNESLKYVKKLTLLGKSAAAAAATPEFSGLRNVAEVKMKHIIEYVNKGSKKGAKQTPALSLKEREKRIETIYADMLRKIHIINPNFRQNLEAELVRSTRGEHVFNNNILKFHSKVLNKFKEAKLDNLQALKDNPRALNGFDSNPLNENTAREIQYQMVVHFDNNEFYVNANAVMYGEYSRVLHDALLSVLNNINPDDVTENHRNRVNFVINNMNNLQIYVDFLARAKWFEISTNPQDREARFNVVTQEVADMYREGRGLDWCIRILRVVAPWFSADIQ